MYVLNIDKDRGLFYCHRCQAKGKWNDFRAKYLGLEDNDKVQILMNEELHENVGSNIATDISDAEHFLY